MAKYTYAVWEHYPDYELIPEEFANYDISPSARELPTEFVERWTKHQEEADDLEKEFEKYFDIEDN